MEAWWLIFQDMERFELLACSGFFLSTVYLLSCKSLRGSALRDTKNQKAGLRSGPKDGWIAEIL